MGNRAFIQVESQHLETPVVLYGHWAGESNLTAVRNVLARTDRIGDPNYLTAQIFYEFAVVLGDYDGNLGFGIDSGVLTDSVWSDVDNVYVNADTGEYRCGGTTYSEFVRANTLTS